MWKRLALPILAVAIVLQLLVLDPARASAVGGNQNWLRVGPVTVQPSEIVKVGAGARRWADPGREAQAPARLDATSLVPYLVPDRRVQHRRSSCSATTSAP